MATIGEMLGERKAQELRKSSAERIMARKERRAWQVRAAKASAVQRWIKEHENDGREYWLGTSRGLLYAFSFSEQKAIARMHLG